jgi:hypothetical protein
MDSESQSETSNDARSSEDEELEDDDGPGPSSASSRDVQKRKRGSVKKFRGAFLYSTKFDMKWIAKNQQCKGNILIEMFHQCGN